MSHDARLARLEATFTAAVTPENRGAYCPACGGITIEDVMLAIDTQDRGGTYMTAEAAQAVCDALEAGEATYRRCGDVTLYGATLPMLAEERRRDALLCDGHLGTRGRLAMSRGRCAELMRDRLHDAHHASQAPRCGTPRR